MSDKWKEIWSNRELIKPGRIELENLIHANGFDNGVGSYSSKTWRQMVADFCKRIRFIEPQNILEIGCGSGAFIYAANEIMDVNWYGVDYSSTLIDIAKRAVPSGNFINDEAVKQNFSNTSFDCVFSHSVFHYFPDVKYANEVLENWCTKLNKNGLLLLLDVNDADHEEHYHKERAKDYHSAHSYAEAYKDLNHLFFNKERITVLLDSLGMSEIEFFPHAIREYGNSKFRFNLICKKT